MDEIPPHPKKVGKQVALRMEMVGISQQELAARSGVSTSTIRKLTSGAQERFQAPKLAAISRALQWPPDAIMRLFRGEPLYEDRVKEREPAALTQKLDRLTAAQRETIERLVDELLGPDE